MNNNTERFIEQFNYLENALKIRLNKSNKVSFSALVSEASVKDPFIRKHKSLLNSFRELRNVLVHEEGNRIIATPTDEAVRAITKMVGIYTKPKRMDALFGQKVISVSADQPLINALDQMKYHGYSNLPVYDKGNCIGLLTGRVVTKWLLGHYNEEGAIDISVGKVKIRSVLKAVSKIDEVQIIPRSLDIISFVKLVNEHPSPSGIYLLTENGKVSEKPLGIITGKDMPKVYDELKM